jgi:hypothetical protein
MKFFRVSIGSTALALVAVGAAPASRGASAAGVCGLITRQEAAAALGAAVPAGAEKIWDFAVKGGSIKAQSCFYGTEVSITRFQLGSDAPGVFGGYRQSLTSKSDYQNVTGVGDEAFLAKGQLAVRKGQSGFIIDVGQARGGGVKEQNAEKALATLAIGRN